MNELSVYVIKPEAMAARDAIRREIEAAGLTIIASTMTRLDSHDVDMIYPELPISLRNASIHFLCASEVEIGVVSGENAIGKLLALIGESVNPLECGSTSLRRQYGQAQPDISFGASYFLNALHRSTSSREAQHDVRTFERLSGKRVSEHLGG